MERHICVPLAVIRFEGIGKHVSVPDISFSLWEHNMFYFLICNIFWVVDRPIWLFRKINHRIFLLVFLNIFTHSLLRQRWKSILSIMLSISFHQIYWSIPYWHHLVWGIMIRHGTHGVLLRVDGCLWTSGHLQIMSISL